MTSVQTWSTANIEVWFRSPTGQEIKVSLHLLPECLEKLGAEAWATIEAKLLDAQQNRRLLEGELKKAKNDLG